MKLKLTSVFVAFVLFAVFFVIAIEAQANTEKQWQFRVFLDDKEIGYHKVRLTPEEDGRRVSVEAKFDVKFFFITAYRYDHQTEEFWEGACLTDIQSRTDNNGEQLFIRKQPEGNNFTLETHDGQQELQGCVRSFAYWDPELLKTSRLLNTQTGEYQDVEIIEMGNNPIEIDGRLVEAVQYRLMIEGRSIDLWYTPEMDWLALKSMTEGGYRLSYYPAGETF
jgi:hypothetical protein